MKYAFCCLLLACAAAHADSGPRLFTLRDVFDLEWISGIDVSRDGRRIVYLRNAFDVMSDRARNALWLIDASGTAARPLLQDFGGLSSPRWSPDGRRVAFVTDGGGANGPQLYVYWVDTGTRQRLTQLTEAPESLAWSPDGRSLAFLMRVAGQATPIATLPEKPAGANWAPPARVVDRLIYRHDGGGYVEPGYVQVFVVPAEGGTPLQLTDGPFDHEGPPAWLPDGRHLVVSGNRRGDWEYDPSNTELYEIDVATRAVTALTDRHGPDDAPAVAPDGRQVAYLGYDDDHRSHIDAALYLYDRATRTSSRLSPTLPGAIEAVRWADDGRSLVVQYDAQGETHLASIDRSGRMRDLVAEKVGGLDLGRPYAGAEFAFAGDTLAFTTTNPNRPADLAVLRQGHVVRLTDVNADLLGERDLAPVTSRWLVSPVDGTRIQAWLVTPPGFDPARKYPLILEIHGGPHQNYGPRFAAEMQLYAAAGYLVLYCNPRGSTSYGEAFANLIDKDYPGKDYDDLMAAVDSVVAEGFVDPRNLFVTGGSGGGILTAWIVGKTDRFRAAVSVKPVINWMSFMMTSDIGSQVDDRWFHGVPWEHVDEYVRRSPLALVGNVTTPTMLFTGESDYRTPMSESEQFYLALRLRKVDTALVRVPEASHALVGRPSQLASKVAYVLGWFERYRAR